MEQGHTVIVLDNLFTGSRDNIQVCPYDGKGWLLRRKGLSHLASAEICFPEQLQ